MVIPARLAAVASLAGLPELQSADGAALFPEATVRGWIHSNLGPGAIAQVASAQAADSARPSGLTERPHQRRLSPPVVTFTPRLWVNCGEAA